MGRFKELVAKLQKHGEPAHEANAVAAIAGRKKYGKKRFQQMAAEGRKQLSLSEQVQKPKMSKRRRFLHNAAALAGGALAVRGVLGATLGANTIRHAHKAGIFTPVEHAAAQVGNAIHYGGSGAIGYLVRKRSLRRLKEDKALSLASTAIISHAVNKLKQRGVGDYFRMRFAKAAPAARRILHKHGAAVATVGGVVGGAGVLYHHGKKPDDTTGDRVTRAAASLLTTANIAIAGHNLHRGILHHKAMRATPSHMLQQRHRFERDIRGIQALRHGALAGLGTATVYGPNAKAREKMERKAASKKVKLSFDEIQELRLSVNTMAGRVAAVAKSTYGKVANRFRRVAPAAKAFFNKATSFGRKANATAAAPGVKLLGTSAPGAPIHDHVGKSWNVAGKARDFVKNNVRVGNLRGLAAVGVAGGVGHAIGSRRSKAQDFRKRNGSTIGNERY